MSQNWVAIDTSLAPQRGGLQIPESVMMASTRFADLVFPETQTATGIIEAIYGIGPRPGVIHLAAGDWLIDSEVTIPINVHLEIERGALLTKSGSGAITINGSFAVPLFQVFAGFAPGDVAIGVGACSAVFPQWWGARGNGTVDDTLAVQCAITSAPAARNRWPRGTYRITSSINLTYHWASFVGDGMESTILKADPGVTLFSIPAGSTGRHGITFEGIVFRGQDAAPFNEYGFAVPDLQAYGMSFVYRDCKFGNLKGCFNYSGKTVEATGSKFDHVEFENAPCHLESTGIGNLLNWSHCRFSAMAQNVPSLTVREESEASSSTNVVFDHCDWEGNDRAATEFTRVRGISFSNCYWEQNLKSSSGAINSFNECVGVAFHQPYAYAYNAADVFMDSDAVIYGVHLLAPLLTNFASYPQWDTIKTPGWLRIGSVDEEPSVGSRFSWDVRFDAGLTAEKVRMGPNGPTITTGEAVPSAVDPDGSVYLRSGSPNGSLYVRTNGTWVLK